MNQFLRSGLLLIAACGSSISLHAQTALYSTDFPNDQGWELRGMGSGYPEWAVDATPASVLAGPAWHSAPFSLNFNNGVNLGPNGEGWATSPLIDLAAANGLATLGFWCNYSTETELGCSWDTRKMEILDDAGGVLILACFGKPYCGPMGTWHFHSFGLYPQWGTIQVRFTFDTIDSSSNGGEGWFIDDLIVTTDCLGATTYCTAKVNSQGCTPDIFATGTPSLSASGAPFRIWAKQVLNQTPGILRWGHFPGSVFTTGGFACVAGVTIVTPVGNSGGTSLPTLDCSGTFALHFSPALMNQALFGVGNEVYAQYWYRDAGFTPPYNVGSTAGLHWLICP